MKIGLISPKSSFLGKNELVNEFWRESKYIDTYKKEWSGLSVALTVIAALTPTDNEIDIIDENVDNIDFSIKYDIVGITCMTQQATRAYEISDTFRNKGVKVIIGGIHVTVLPNEAIEHADCVVIGEAEYLWEQVLNDFKNNKLKKFYKSEKPVNLINSPIPRYDLLKGKDYSYYWIQSSRGCPHDCNFCAASKVYGYKYRYKSINQVIEEIRFVKELYPEGHIIFADDNAFVNKIFARQLLERLIPFNIRYTAETDISIAHDDRLLESIKKSGCTHLFIGLESLSENTLKHVDINNWKSKQLNRYVEYIEKIQSYGIGVMGAFIIGFNEDDESVFQRIVDFVQNNYLYNAQISILTPFPGTRIREQLAAENRILPANWSNYTAFDVNIIHKKLTAEDMIKGLIYIYKNIHSKEYYEKKITHFKKIHLNILLRKQHLIYKI